MPSLQSALNDTREPAEGERSETVKQYRSTSVSHETRAIEAKIETGIINLFFIILICSKLKKSRYKNYYRKNTLLTKVHLRTKYVEDSKSVVFLEFKKKLNA
jgi:hypothetical protein